MIRFNFSEMERLVRDLGAAPDQVRYAISNALNTATFQARQTFIDQTWPQHVEVRNRNFMRAALRVEKSTKRNLVSAVTTEGTSAGTRGHIEMHAHGGIKQANGRLAIPDRKILGRRGAKGLPKNLRPSTLPNSFRKGDVIYQRTGKGKKERLRLMFVLKPSAPIKADVPFERDFDTVMRRELGMSLPAAVARAMAGRR